VHWNPEEARPRVEQLRSAGYQVDFEPVEHETLRRITSDTTAAILIDLTRLPSHGKEVGLAFRARKSTRSIPLVFLGGEPEKVERLRAALPDAVYAEWPRFKSAIKNAIAHPPERPHVPKSVMDGYAGTPLPKKLGIKPNFSVALVEAPDDFERTLGDVPDGVDFTDRVNSRTDLILWFLRSAGDLELRIGRMANATPSGGIWIIWPKKASGLKTDLNGNIVREMSLAHGLVDFKICAVDATWSGLKFSRRKMKNT
jgi:CheY-like chemotaxis protein